MKVAFLLATLMGILGANPLLGQESETPNWKPAVTAGLFAGLGSGPIDAAVGGIELTVPVWSRFSVTAEASGWGNGLGGTDCVAMPPDSHRCSVSGWAGVLALRFSVPLRSRLSGFGEIGVGRFSRDWIGDERVESRAISAKAGVSIRIRGRLEVRVGGRFLRMFDQDYEALLQERLEYMMATVGLAVRLGS